MRMINKIRSITALIKECQMMYYDNVDYECSWYDRSCDDLKIRTNMCIMWIKRFEFDSFGIVYVWFMRSSDEWEKKAFRLKESEEIVVAATNKELHFDWIMRSPNDRHSTGSFYSLIDGRHQMLNDYFFNFSNDFIHISINFRFLVIPIFKLMILIISLNIINISS